MSPLFIPKPLRCEIESQSKHSELLETGQRFTAENRNRYVLHDHQ